MKKSMNILFDKSISSLHITNLHESYIDEQSNDNNKTQ